MAKPKSIEVLVRSDLEQSKLIELLVQFNMTFKYAPKYSKGYYYFNYLGKEEELKDILLKLKSTEGLYEATITKEYKIPEDDLKS